MYRVCFVFPFFVRCIFSDLRHIVYGVGVVDNKCFRAFCHILYSTIESTCNVS
jgi:hypothetical protein